MKGVPSVLGEKALGVLFCLVHIFAIAQIPAVHEAVDVCVVLGLTGAQLLLQRIIAGLGCLSISGTFVAE